VTGRLRISREHLRELIAAGDLEAFKIGDGKTRDLRVTEGSMHPDRRRRPSPDPGIAPRQVGELQQLEHALGRHDRRQGVQAGQRCRYISVSSAVSCLAAPVMLEAPLPSLELVTRLDVVP